MTIRIAVLGIDGSGKSTLVAGLAERLARRRSVMSIGQCLTLYQADGARRQLLDALKGSAPPLRHFLRNLQRHALLQRLPRLLARYRPDLCLEDRDGLIDICALGAVYLPGLGCVPPGRRIALWQWVSRRGPANCYLVLRLPVSLALHRISKKAGSTRRRRAYHEAPHRLVYLDHEYCRFAAALREAALPVALLDASRPADIVLDQASNWLSAAVLDR